MVTCGSRVPPAIPSNSRQRAGYPPPYSARVAFVFPGQASQQAGMAGALLAKAEGARRVFGQASTVLGLDLAGVCTTGDDALLTRTDIAQPALLTTCCAWLEALRERGVAPALVAGHSLGEFSAWVAGGALEFREGVRLVRRRGELMEEAARRRPGGMAAVLGLPDEQVRELCSRAGSAGVVVAANFNCPGQVVVSGEEAALDKVRKAAEAAGGKTMGLRVSGAFHSSLMEDAALAFGELVKGLSLRDPATPVVVNATAEVVRGATRAREMMAAQMTSPVLWTDCIRRMTAEGVRTFVEVGPGQVLTRLIQRISAAEEAAPHPASAGGGHAASGGHTRPTGRPAQPARGAVRRGADEAGTYPAGGARRRGVVRALSVGKYEELDGLVRELER